MGAVTFIVPRSGPFLPAPYDVDHVHAQRVADDAQLDEVKAALPGLVGADEALATAEALGDLHLREPGCLATLPEERDQAAVSFAVEGLLHPQE
jgi:hypothetical protein